MGVDTYIIYAIIVSVALLVSTGIYSTFGKNKKAMFLASSALLFVIALLSLILIALPSNYTLFNLVHIYPFSSLFMALFALVMLLVNVLSYSKSNDYHNLLLLLSLSFAASFIVSTAMSIVAIFIGLELLATSSAFAILFEGKHRMEAAVKFFILSSVSVAVFAFALSMLFPYNMQLSLSPVVQNPNLTDATLALLSMVLFIVAFGFDTALFPFNLWVPDVYEGAPTYITSMLAGFNKKVAFVALIEVLFFVFLAYRSTFSVILVVLATVTMFFGNLVALAQDNMKRMFAYSSISQAGYILVGLAAATQFGIEASIFYIVAHAFMIVGAFALIMWLESKNIRTIEDYSSLNSKNQFASISLTIIMLSMAGIPPLIGFAGKFLLFSSAIDANIVILAVFGVINSFISIYYYARVINSMYTSGNAKRMEMDRRIAVIVVICLAAIILFGVYPQPLITVASRAAGSILGI